MNRKFAIEKPFKLCFDNLQDDSLDVSSVDSMTMLELITEIDTAIADVGLGDEGMQCIRLWLNALARRQGLSAKKMLVIAIVMNFHVEGGAYIKDIVSLCRCTNMSMLLLQSDIEQLVAEGWLTKSEGVEDHIRYGVTEGLLEAYSANRPFTLRDYKCEDTIQFLSEFSELAGQLNLDEISAKLFGTRFRRLVEANPELPLVKSLGKMQLKDHEQAIMLRLCEDLALAGDAETNIRFGLMFLVPQRALRPIVLSSLTSGSGKLFTLGLVEHPCNDGIRDNTSLSLSKKAVRSLLGDLNLKQKDHKCRSTSIVAHKNIAEKTLFFDEKVKARVDQLANILQDDNFRNIQDQLRGKGLRTGFSCIFYGAPGTGKTETALQLARATGRDIMQVNISDIRSKWVGESEKNIQQLFDDYRRQAKARAVCPILLFNEADAIFNQRNGNTRHAVDKMENAIQNIILQEMEKLEGILIATTNLEGNLDKAFERRFLYKVEFTKPGLDARAHIWQSLMPSLDEPTAQLLAHDFDLSGGQIENVARKTMVDEILYGAEYASAARLREYCEDESFDKKSCRQIGFNAA